MKYSHLTVSKEDFYPTKRELTQEKLNPGAYVLEFDQGTQDVYFVTQAINHDGLIHLPNTEYDAVIREVEEFLKPETKNLFSEFEFLYKRGIFLYGVPGTGKTCMINRVTEQVIKSGGIVLFNPHPTLLPRAYKVLDDLQPDTTVMVILEEFDSVIKDSYNESCFLSLLDGEVQKNNVIYMATTNNIEKVPARLYRPGRFATVLEVKFPSAEARAFYLKEKLGDKVEINQLVGATEGLSIDELKEVALAVYCLKQDLNSVVERIKKVKKTQKDSNFNENEQGKDLEKLSYAITRNIEDSVDNFVGKRS